MALPTKPPAEEGPPDPQTDLGGATMGPSHPNPSHPRRRIMVAMPLVEAVSRDVAAPDGRTLVGKEEMVS